MADAQQRGMGRGLAAILPRSDKVEDGLREIPLDLIQPNARQPRRTFDQARLAELAESIRTRGVLQPIVVRPLAGGSFELVAGERRLRAAQMVELETIPALVRDTDDWERLDLALAENMARVDLNAIEEARACAMLVDDLGPDEAGGRPPGRPQPRRDLEPDQAARAAGGGARADRARRAHARATAARSSSARTTRRAAAWRSRRATAAWSVRETERRAREAEGQPEPEAKRFTRELHPDLAEALAAAEDTLSAAFGQPVKVRPRGDGCRVELDFDTPADAVALAERILARGHLKAA